MRIAVLGLGYVGCTAVACLTSQGHDLIGFDVSADKVNMIARGQSPISEPRVADMLASALVDGRLRASTDIGDELDSCDIAIVCVGTPSGADGAHNMSYIIQVTQQIAAAIKPERAKALTVIYRSTMRPGTIDAMVAPIFRSRLGEHSSGLIELVYNPEFLREASAVDDYFNPPKIVVGTADGLPSEALTALYAGIDAPIFNVHFAEAELTKFVDNSWHALKVAYANEIGRVCGLLNISATKVHEIFVSDTKLNISPYYLRPGGPFGGSCLPKDVRALQYISSELGANTPIVDSLVRSNEAHKHFQFLRVEKLLHQNDHVLMVGLAFKDKTDDLRESPSIDLARKLLAAGYKLDIYDPALTPAKLVGQNLGYAYANLPAVDSLLIDKSTAESRSYNLVIGTTRLHKTLNFQTENIIDVSVVE